MSLVPSRHPRNIFDPTAWEQYSTLMSSTAQEAPKPPLLTMGFIVESIENGFIISYSKPELPSRKRFAADLGDVGQQITAAMVECELRGAAQPK